jgi:hypothetical protein
MPGFTVTPAAALVATRRLVQPGFIGMIAAWESCIMRSAFLAGTKAMRFCFKFLATARI